MIDLFIYSPSHPYSALPFGYLFCVFAVTINLQKLLYVGSRMPGAKKPLILR